MKRGYVYTLVFMVVLSAVLTFALAFAYEAFKPAIAKHEQLRDERALLYAFGRDKGLTDDEVHPLYTELVREGGLGEGSYSLVEGGETLGYAVPFEGAGLWGTIQGYLGITADKGQVTGLVFTSQNETPGLGGRIDEEDFKAQFRELPIQAGSTLRYGSQAGYTLDAVSGATQTSSAVLRILNGALTDKVFQTEVK